MVKRKAIIVNSRIDVEEEPTYIEEKGVNIEKILDSLRNLTTELNRRIYVDACVFHSGRDYLIARRPYEYDSSVLLKIVQFNHGLVDILEDTSNFLFIPEVLNELQMKEEVTRRACKAVTELIQSGQEEVSPNITELIERYGQSERRLHSAITAHRGNYSHTEINPFVFDGVLELIKELDREVGLKKPNSRSDTDERLVAAALTDALVNDARVTVLSKDQDVFNLLHHGHLLLQTSALTHVLRQEAGRIYVAESRYIAGLSMYTNKHLELSNLDDPRWLYSELNPARAKSIIFRTHELFDALSPPARTQEREYEPVQKVVPHAKQKVRLARKTVSIGGHSVSVTVDEEGCIVGGRGRRKAKEAPLLEESDEEIISLFDASTPTEPNVSPIVNSVVRDYQMGSNPQVTKFLTKIGLRAAENAVRRFNWSSKDYPAHQREVENHVRYALFIGALTGKSTHSNTTDIRELLDDEGRLRFLKVYKREMAAPYYEGDVSIDINTTAGRLVARDELQRLLENKDPREVGIYHLTADLRSILGLLSLSPIYVHSLIPQEVQAEIPTPITNLRSALAIRSAFEGADNATRSKYASPAGAYLLGRAIKNKQGVPIDIEEVVDALATQRQRESLFTGSSAKDNVATLDWKQEHFKLSLDKLEAISDFLEMKFGKDRETFMRRYGCITGDYNLALDSGERNLSALHQVSGSRMVASDLIGFELGDAWNPAAMPCDFAQLQKLFGHLSKRYSRNSNLFFRVYGSPVSTILLAKEMQVSYNTEITIPDIYTIIADGSAVAQSMEVEDSRFSSQWHVHQISQQLPIIEAVISRINEQYRENTSLFFRRYASDQPRLMQELNGKEIDRTTLGYLVQDGLTLSILMGVSDPGFQTWGRRP